MKQIATTVNLGSGQLIRWCAGGDHLAPVDADTGLAAPHPTVPFVRDICHGSNQMAMAIERPFFQPGRTYTHAQEGQFTVAFVGRAPVEYEHHSETLGVAFGWLIAADYTPMGSYSTPDFFGWSEVS